jgi:hypothetical protein
MMRHWKAILGVILIFVLGFTSGVVGSSIVYHRKLATFLKHPGAVAEAALEKRLTRNLKLDENQKKQVHDYFMENLQSRHELSKQIQPQVRATNLETYQQITGILRPDQQEIFRQNIEDLRARSSKIAADTGGDALPPTGTSNAGTPTQH